MNESEEVLLGNLDNATKPGYRMIEAVFDTGACHSCVPPGVFPGKVQPSKMSKAGKKYRGPDKSPIPNLGEIRGHFLSEEDVMANMLWQVAAIERPLIAGTQITKAGNRVELEADGGMITNIKSGKTIRLYRRGDAEGGVYILRMWVPLDPKVGFQRQVKA